MSDLRFTYARVAQRGGNSHADVTGKLLAITLHIIHPDSVQERVVLTL
jgi:hypothetical protein